MSQEQVIFTVADALALDAFSGAEVVAGHAGLTRRVSWVHNVGVPNAAEWLNGGELVLTTTINMPADLAEQGRYLRDLIDKDVAGLIVTVGGALAEVPAELRSIADAHDFPLIQISFRARFVDMARAVNERITEANMTNVRRALNIQQTLTQLVLEGGGLEQLADTLADLVNQSVSIESARFEALASANIAAVDEARRYTLEHGRTDPRLIAALEDEILPEIRRTLRPVFIPQMAHVGLEMERILAPIVVHGEIYGYVWIIADDRPLGDLDHMAIESAATIAALMLLYQESVQSAEASLKGSLLARLVQGEASGDDVLTDQALRYGVDLRGPYRALMLETPRHTSQQLMGLSRRVNRVIVASGISALAGQFAGQIMLLVPAGQDINEMARAITEKTNGQGESPRTPPRIGISSVHAGPENAAAAHAQCREVLHITRRLGTPAPVVCFDDLGYLHALYQAGPDALKGNGYVPSVRALLDEQSADLFHTLEIYLDAGGNGTAAADTLHIHRSTLNYRLQRIGEICPGDLSDPAARLNLQVALKLLRLFEIDPPG